MHIIAENIQKQPFLAPEKSQKWHFHLPKVLLSHPESETFTTPKFNFQAVKVQLSRPVSCVEKLKCLVFSGLRKRKIQPFFMEKIFSFQKNAVF
ncbi:MAG: hypothetical protein IJ698_06425 [Prevotella sp.]|nr:hypothetical protein [Prevotella sp.]